MGAALSAHLTYGVIAPVAVAYAALAAPEAASLCVSIRAAAFAAAAASVGPSVGPYKRKRAPLSRAT